MCLFCLCFYVYLFVCVYISTSLSVYIVANVSICLSVSLPTSLLSSFFPSYTHSLTHSLTYSLTHSLTHPLPYPQIAIRVNLYNSLAQNMLVMVVMEGSEDYRFVHVEGDASVSHYNPRLSRGDHQHLITVRIMC